MYCTWYTNGRMFYFLFCIHIKPESLKLGAWSSKSIFSNKVVDIETFFLFGRRFEMFSMCVLVCVKFHVLTPSMESLSYSNLHLNKIVCFGSVWVSSAFFSFSFSNIWMFTFKMKPDTAPYSVPLYVYVPLMYSFGFLLVWKKWLLFYQTVAYQKKFFFFNSFYFIQQNSLTSDSLYFGISPRVSSIIFWSFYPDCVFTICMYVIDRNFSGVVRLRVLRT